MNTTIKNIQLKRAWQTAFELRLCPDGDTLFSETPDENLLEHLQICHVCREKREMPLAQRMAWQELQRRFAEAVPKPAKPQSVPGQVWSLKGGLAGWGQDGYFYKPPMVLLLEKIKDSRGFKVVQLYSDRLLMGEGDVWLDNDRFGFAQGWNCYSVHEEALDACWGSIADKVLDQVQATVAMRHAPVEEDSIHYFFRRIEINVGARVAVPSVAVLVGEYEIASIFATNEAFLQQIFGALDRVREKTKETLNGWKLPVKVGTVFDFLAGAQPQFVPGQAAVQPQEDIKLINMVSAHEDGLFVGTVTATIRAARANEKGSFFIRCSINQMQGETYHLLACLELADLVREAPPIIINAGTRAFVLTFPEVPASACNAKTVKNNIKMILVRA